MSNHLFKKLALFLALSVLCLPTFAKAPTKASQIPLQDSMPRWIQRGALGAPHAALTPLIGKWHVNMSIYGILGRRPEDPPLVSDDITTTRTWVANGHFIEDTTEGKIGDQPYWRKGWLGYSNIDQRYEWVTIAPWVPMMIYRSQPGSGGHFPINLTGTFTDQGVVGESSVGKPVIQRTVFNIENNDKHTSELYFTPPGGQERLALRIIYTRIK